MQQNGLVSLNRGEQLKQPGTVLLDTARPDEENQKSLLFTRPERALTARRIGEVPAVLAQVDEAVGSGHYVAGYVSYEAGYAFEREAFDAVSAARLPLVWFGVYRSPELLAPHQVEALLGSAGKDPFQASRPELQIQKQDYVAALRQIKEHIREGDVYQINFTDKLTFSFSGCPASFYQYLRRHQRVPYGALLCLEEGYLISCSPELFFRREGQRIRTRPMKGTVRRGRTPQEDRDLRRWLSEDEKSRAENLMIVDLLRNDLSVCCHTGTVHVPALFETERYETLIQMTSTVEGEIRGGTGYRELFTALFPCGSVTGAPKRRAMQLIQKLERAPRGPYCGTIGYASPHDEAVFNVAIRTVTLQEGRGQMGVGSGIVWDSNPGDEFEECQLKGRFLTEGERTVDCSLIETMCWRDGHLQRHVYHLERMAASARHFGFPFEAETFHARVEEAVSGLHEDGCYKVRALLDASGHLSVEAARFSDDMEAPWQVSIAEQRVDTTDPFLYHKTTERGFFEEAYEEARRAGFDEVIFLNEKGEVTEGSRSNVFVRKGGRLLTPPVSSGLLAGTFRRHVLVTVSAASEHVLYPRDLVSADAVYLCNALRGINRAVIEGL